MNLVTLLVLAELNKTKKDVNTMIYLINKEEDSDNFSSFINMMTHKYSLEEQTVYSNFFNDEKQITREYENEYDSSRLTIRIRAVENVFKEIEFNLYSMGEYIITEIDDDTKEEILYWAQEIFMSVFGSYFDRWGYNLKDIKWKFTRTDYFDEDEKEDN